MSFHWGLAEISLRFPGVRSLKEKRGCLRPVLERLRNRFPVSAAEVGDQDRHQVALVGLAVAHCDPGAIHTVLEKIGSFLETQDGVEVLEFEKEIE